ncbi:MAG: nucleotide pyrophosphohydrolase [Terrimonas sp.]|nr:nucleotide pyrophosphohydrolase [Terrimonas sp.]
MNELEQLIEEVVRFRNERDWEQFHNAKDLALALSIEASELNEIFLWKDAADADKEQVKDELADILNYAILLANKFQLNIIEIVHEKLKKNGVKYPVNKAKGNATKYDKL